MIFTGAYCVMGWFSVAFCSLTTICTAVACPLNSTIMESVFHSAHGPTMRWYTGDYVLSAGRCFGSRWSEGRPGFKPRLGACSDTRGDSSYTFQSVLHVGSCFEFIVWIGAFISFWRKRSRYLNFVTLAKCFVEHKIFHNLMFYDGMGRGEFYKVL